MDGLVEGLAGDDESRWMVVSVEEEGKGQAFLDLGSDVLSGLVDSTYRRFLGITGRSSSDSKILVSSKARLMDWEMGCCWRWIKRVLVLGLKF